MFNLGSLSFNIFSIILMICVVFRILQDNNKKSQYMFFLLIAIILDVSQIQGYFIRIAGKEVSYEDAYMAFFLIYSLIQLKYIKIERRLFFFSFCLFAIGIIGIFNEFIVPLPNKIINSDAFGGWDYYVSGLTSKTIVKINYMRFLLIYLRLLEYCVVALILKNTYSFSDYKNIIVKLIPWSKFVIYYGLVEFAFKNILKSAFLSKVNEFVLGIGNNTFAFGEKRMGLYVLQGLTREQSHYALSLFFAIVFLFIYYKKLKKHHSLVFVFYCSLAIAFMVLSGAFSALVYISIILVMLFLFDKKVVYRTEVYLKLVFVLAISVFLFSLLLLLFKSLDDSYYAERFLRIIDNFSLIVNNTWKGKISAYSEIVRFVSIFDTLRDFCNRPIFGLGCGVEWAHSGIVSMLSSIGILGSYFWWRISLFSKQRKTFNVLMVILVILPNLLCGSIDMMLSPVVLIFLNNDLFSVTDLSNKRKISYEYSLYY